MKSDTLIAMTTEEYAEVQRLLQWPEDLPAFDRLNSPINMSEVLTHETDD